MNKGSIYGIKNTETDRWYIGLTRMDYRKRWTKHRHELKYNKHHSDKLQRSYNKYGKDKFEYILLASYNDISDEELSEKEIGFIKKYNSLNDGYNVHNGGLPMSNEARGKMKESHKNQISHKRILNEEEVFILLPIIDRTTGTRRLLANLFGCNKIVTTGLKERTSYKEITEKYDNLTEDEKNELFNKSIKYFKENYSIDFSERYQHSRTMKTSDVFLALALYENGFGSMTKIGAIFGLSKHSIRSILIRRTYVSEYDEYQNLTEEEKRRILLEFYKTDNFVPSSTVS